MNLDAIKNLKFKIKIYYFCGQKGHIKRNYKKATRSINKTLKIIKVMENNKRINYFNNGYWTYNTYKNKGNYHRKKDNI